MEDNIKTGFKEILCGMDWIDKVQDRDQWSALRKTEKAFRFHKILETLNKISSSSE